MIRSGKQNQSSILTRGSDFSIPTTSMMMRVKREAGAERGIVYKEEAEAMTGNISVLCNLTLKA